MTQQRIIITLVAAAFFIEGLDGSIMNTSLPQIAFSLHTTPLHLKIALTTYLLMAGIFIPISGWLADKFGTKVIFRLALGIFLFGSVLCGFSHNLSLLVCGRIIQGIGGALSVPIGRLLLVRNFSKAEFIYTMSTVATFALIGPSIGPLVGGFLTTYVNWRFIFFVNVPICLFAFYYVQRYISNETDPHIKPFDFLGFIILAVSLTTLLVAFDTITEHALSWFVNFIVMILGALGLVVYWYYARKRDYAVINTQIFDHAVFRRVVLHSTTMRLGLGVLPFMGPLLLQLGLGFSAMVSGIYTAIAGVAMILAKSLIRVLLRHFTSGTLAALTAFCLFISFNLNILICYYPYHAVILSVFVINGLLASLQFSAMNSLSYNNLSPSLQSTGTSFLSSLQQLMQSFGIALAALILYLCLHGQTDTTHYSVNAFALAYALLSLLPLCSAVGFYTLRHQDMPRAALSE
jgi:EmrB/QacA subfamily drug resistance transporter